MIKLCSILMVFLVFGNTYANDTTSAKTRLEQVGVSNFKFNLFPDIKYSKEEFAVITEEAATIYETQFPTGSVLVVTQGWSISKDEKKPKTSDALKIIMLPKGKSVIFQGANCTRLELDRGDLIQCALAENLVINGLEIPKGSQLHYDRNLKKDKIAVPVLISNLQKDVSYKGKTFKKYRDMIKITDSGEFTTEGAKNIFNRIHPHVGT